MSIILWLWLIGLNSVPAAGAAGEPATFLVRILQLAPPRLAVTATLAMNGKALQMETTRPADVPEVGDRGWPALVCNLRVTDATGGPIEAISTGETGWELKQPYVGRLTVEYEVDYSLLAAHGWPAPREAAFADANHFMFVGRSFFITTREVGPSVVTLVAPGSWRPVTPWRPAAKQKNAFAVGAREDLGQNLLVLTRSEPDIVNRNSWGHTIAHEIFHYWNGWRLRGSDYASSQWFQEGFTEYAANVAMVASGLLTPDEFRQQLSDHIRNYRKLTTTLEAIGSRKGPPLYSGGALVAFCWEVQMRHASNGERNIGDFLRALWRQTSRGQRAYEWHDIRAALHSTARLDWDAFFRAYIRGTEPLPLDEILPQAGLRLVQAADGSSRVELDPHASAAGRSLWRALVKGQ